jgi:hypothetical protein
MLPRFFSVKNTERRLQIARLAHDLYYLHDHSSEAHNMKVYEKEEAARPYTLKHSGKVFTHLVRLCLESK